MNAIRKFEEYERAKGMDTFYRCSALNDSGAVCFENVKWICDHFDEFSRIRPQGRPSYRVAHDGVMPTLATNRTEEMIAVAIANAINAGQNPFEGLKLSRLCEYQVPMKKDRANSAGVGKAIDLVAVLPSEKTALIMELKKPPKINSKGEKVARQKEESVLRCLLEAYTYAKWVNNDAFRSHFNVEKIAICPVVFHRSRASAEWEGASKNGIAELVKRIRKSGVEVYFQTLDAMQFGFKPILVDKRR